MVKPTPRLRPDAAALALSLAVVSVNASLYPTMPIDTAGAMLNEWIILFTVLYALLQGLSALTQRALSRGGVPAPRREPAP